ncbi:peptidase M75 [Leptospira gomenensis]|uniref:Peptidase M75 n=1 Tax=Leptospira gomenensis TaxID=2484974 RepID=A0A5F1YE19_9LEPT|nr:imelysin family protein [Leptospira gomenensis]TGK34335.1 peptidase M75 [Leptospira gomenensis]TGK37303.1 peptidase M75 [Leptospira gomenensis]TGK50990.1 peptidase M75 [Leptospira gomenensis]TGK56612.1 peptidase M75 [Leptospira gomenensis]
MNLKKILRVSLLSISVLSLTIHCKPKESEDNSFLVIAAAIGSAPSASKAQVVDRYLALGYQSYDKSYQDAIALETAVNAYTNSAANHTNLKNLYIKARASYLLTEAFRFSGGPIDNTAVVGCGSNADGSGAEECEGLINAWPLDETAIDNYGGANTYTAILAANGTGGNEGDPEKSITVGWHAIEYILWGSDTGGGNETISGVATSADVFAKQAYLAAITGGLVKQLKLVRDQFSDGTVYSTSLKSNPDAAITAIFQGLGKFIAGEWGGERLTGTFGGDQEEEHSCFSDTTKADFYYDAQGVLNVWNGSYELQKGVILSTGPGLSSLYGTLTAPPMTAQLTRSRDAFCLNLPEQTADPNYTATCPTGSLTERYDQIIKNAGTPVLISEYQILFDTQFLIGDTIKKTITDAAKAVGVAITDFSI